MRWSRAAIRGICVIAVLASSTGGAAPSSPNERVIGFLQAWLVKRDVKLALDYFSPAAFANKLIASESCVGEVEAVTRDEARDRVYRFLVDFSEEIKGTTLRDILNLDTLVQASGWEEMRKRAINRVEDDRFIVFKATRAMAAGLGETPSRQSYLRTHIPEPRVHIALIPVFGGIVFTIWTGESEHLLIYDIGTFCM